MGLEKAKRSKKMQEVTRRATKETRIDSKIAVAGKWKSEERGKQKVAGSEDLKQRLIYFFTSVISIFGNGCSILP